MSGLDISFRAEPLPVTAALRSSLVLVHHSPPPIDSVFSFCSHDTNGEVPNMNAPARSSELETEIAASLEAEVDEAIATCGGDVRAALRATLIANAYLETEIERLTEATSTGFARGRLPPQRVKVGA